MEDALNKAWKKGFETATGDMDEIMNNKDATIASLTAENERLREACRLFVEYDDDPFEDSASFMLRYDMANTAIRAALQPKEGEQ